MYRYLHRKSSILKMNYKKKKNQVKNSWLFAKEEDRFNFPFTRLCYLIHAIFIAVTYM